MTSSLQDFVAYNICIQYFAIHHKPSRDNKPNKRQIHMSYA